LLAIAGPRIGFIGAISGYKQDFELLCEVADRHPEWSLVLIGEVGEGDPRTDVSTLRQRPNVHLLGPRPYGDLPAYLKGMDVAVLPNRINEYTAAMFPMKFFEYLAAGRPVVSVNLPSLQAYADTVCLSHSSEEFMQGITDALAGRCAPMEQRISLARQNTYSARMDRMLDILVEPNE
jgi:glycosyltransferase involved in cell wall biosynthesis